MEIKTKIWEAQEIMKCGNCDKFFLADENSMWEKENGCGCKGGYGGNFESVDDAQEYLNNLNK